MPSSPETHSEDSNPLGLETFAEQPEDAGLSLDKLSAAFAEMLNTGDDPYAAPADEEDAEPVREGSGSIAASTRTDVSPRTILEALLFVGSPRSEPLTSQQVAGLMRGVRPAEIDALVVELNSQYDSQRCPYRIVSEGAGYRLALRGEYARVRDKFYGRARQARLSQAAIEVLAAVAYHGPLTAEEVNNMRGTSSGPILTQLVRRQLLRVERAERKSHGRYSTTPRFLELFGLHSLEDLPRSEELGET